ncbi:MAG: hypothetical protein ACRC5G_02705 [Cetobacterium sp.]
MSFVTTQHHQSFESFWVTNTGIVQNGATSNGLAPQTIGIFDCGPNCDPSKSTNTPSFKKSKRFKIKMGIDKIGADFLIDRTLDNPFETICFSADQIVSLEAFGSEYPSKQNWKQHKIALGYDGFDASKSINSKLDASPLVFSIILQGDPIQRYFGQNQVTYEFPVDKGLCVDDCNCTDSCGKVDCKRLLEGLKKSMAFSIPRVTNGGAVVQRPITDFVKINTISKCSTTTPVVVPVLLEYSKYTITIPDEGDNLGYLAQANPSASVSIEKREGGKTTYSFWQKSSAPVPANYVVKEKSYPVCNVCPTCPGPTTSVPSAKVIQVRVACGATAPTFTGQLTTSLISSSLDGDVYLITVPSTATDAAINAQITGCEEGSIVGSTDAYCEGASTTYTWTTCETCNKTEKEYMITLQDKDCPSGDHLADLQASYPDLVVSVGQSIGCAKTYLTKVFSDCVQDDVDCPVTENTDYTFKAPAPFKGSVWVDSATVKVNVDCTDVVSVDECCVCGIVLEGKAFLKDSFVECDNSLYEHNPGDLIGVKVHATAYTYSATGSPCNVSKEYVTTLQTEKIPTGITGLLAQKYERAELAYKGKYWSGNSALDNASGFKLNAKPRLMYDQIRLTLSSKLNYPTNGLMHGVDNIAYNFLVPKGQSSQLQASLNALIASSGKDVDMISI